jgi:peptidoglycan/xylan/chitin deacetylase (PgdA/CDA1 family)
MQLKHRMFAAGFQAIALSRADHWLGFLARGKGVILMFHRVRPAPMRSFAPNRLLEITPEFLDVVLTELRYQGFEIIPLETVPDRLRRNSDGTRFAALTFDDGYRDNAEYAWPVLRRHGAPWTLFITTEFAAGRGRLWWVELEEAIARLDRVVITCNGQNIDLRTRTPAEKEVAFEKIIWHLRAGSEESLRRTIGDLAREAGVAARQLAAESCLNWDEIGILAREPEVTIGAHTLSHPILSKHDTATAMQEISQSKVVLEQRLGRPITCFAYPGGDNSCARVREFQLARLAGFALAVTSRPGHLFASHAGHLHALPRVSVNGLFQTEIAVRALLSGVPFLAWNFGRIAPIE